MIERNKLVPELVIENLRTSLAFWVGCLGFSVVYERKEEGFAYLDLNGAQLMLEQAGGVPGQWQTAPLERPLGRGVNFQIEVPAVEPVLKRLAQAQHALFRGSEECWYRAGATEVGQREFLVQDPDGYLVRLIERLGERPLA